MPITEQVKVLFVLPYLSIAIPCIANGEDGTLRLPIRRNQQAVSTDRFNAVYLALTQDNMFVKRVLVCGSFMERLITSNFACTIDNRDRPGAAHGFLSLIKPLN